MRSGLLIKWRKKYQIYSSQAVGVCAVRKFGLFPIRPEAKYILVDNKKICHNLIIVANKGRMQNLTTITPYWRKVERRRQAGAELCQVQVKLCYSPCSPILTFKLILLFQIGYLQFPKNVGHLSFTKKIRSSSHF